MRFMTGQLDHVLSSVLFGASVGWKEQFIYLISLFSSLLCSQHELMIDWCVWPAVACRIGWGIVACTRSVRVPTPPGKSWKNILESHAFF